MIQISDKTKCCGCEACVQVCPKHCIAFNQDKEGFFYPKVDIATCINCGLCEKVCPELMPYEERKPLEVIAAINKDDAVRAVSSSGGVFSLLAKEVIRKGGVVFGVRFDENWLAVFDCAKTLEQVAAFRGSKYMQARVGDSFKECKRYLDEGRQVLFAGTQCQIAALSHYLRMSYTNLLTVDFICHGVPSPMVWSKYLDEVVIAGKKAITDISFRNKRNGWKKFNFVLEYCKDSNQYTISTWFNNNLYCNAFDKNLILRPSCHSCPAKAGRSHSDLTIADFWGINIVNPDMDDDKGTSLVLVNTPKGMDLLQRKHLRWAQASYEDVLKYNPSVVNPAVKHKHREEFFASFSNGDDALLSLIEHCMRPSIKLRMKAMVKYPFRVAKHILFGKLCGGGKFKYSPLPVVCDNSVFYVSSIQFRSKAMGWKKYELSITLAADKNSVVI